MILPNQFYGLLDCLAGQFFSINSARCVGKDFGGQMIAGSSDYFSLAISPEILSRDQAVLGLLLDDSAHIPSRRGYTFTVYIDVSKIDGKAFKIFSSIILAHEICHFVFYYELFLNFGGNTGTVVHNHFTNAVCDTLKGSITQEQDSTSQTIFDEHNITELVKNMGKYPKKHFAKEKETKIDYHKFFYDFLNHLRFNEMLEEYKKV